VPTATIAIDDDIDARCSVDSVAHKPPRKATIKYPGLPR
jgi:hypothetical protein